MASQPRILIVGCGGTGFEALLQLKALFLKSPGKTPPHVGMLYLDTVAPKDRTSTSGDDWDYVQLVLRDAPEMLRNPDNAYLLQWFPATNGNIVSSAHGAAQVRPMGRLTLHAQADRVLRQLRNCLAKLTSRERLRQADGTESIADQGSVEVYVLASLCGGTGSGISLDVAQLLRQELKDAPHIRIVGIFLLPGPFRNLPGTDLVKSNAYAALKELDYLVSPRGKVDFTFGTNHPMALDRSPFDLVYLVDSIGEHYDTTQNIQQLARQIAHLPYLMSNPAFGPYVRETLHNLIPQLESKDTVQGKRAVYASFGVSSLEIPESSVARARLDFEQELLSLLLADRHPAESLADLGARDVLQRVGQEEFPESLEMYLLEFDFGNSREPIDKLQEIYAATLGLLENQVRRIVGARLEALRESGEKKIEALLDRAAKHAGCIRSSLREYIRLQTLLRELQDILQTPGREAEAEKERKLAWDFCQHEFKSRRRRRREPAALAWKNVVNTLVLPTRFKRTIDELSTDTLGYLIDRLQEAVEWCSGAVTNLEEALRRVSEANIPMEKEPGPFTRYCEVKGIRPQADASRFLEGLPDPRSWFQLSESDIRPNIKAFEDQEFASAFAVGGASSATQLLQKDPHRYISELRRFSDPLWSYTLDKIPPEHHRGIHHIEVLGVDTLSSDVASLAGLYPLVHLVETGWWNRVSHLQIRAGIPLFALSCMNELWRDYSGSGNGRRERSHIDRRWVGWPEPLPHAFKRNIIQTFALGLACSEIMRSDAGDIKLKDTTVPGRSLGQRFQQAYAAMSADPLLCAAIFDSSKLGIEKCTAPDVTTKAGHLWDLLIQDRIVPLYDRPLVEALAHCLDQMAQRWPVGVLANYAEV